MDVDSKCWIPSGYWPVKYRVSLLLVLILSVSSPLAVAQEESAQAELSRQAYLSIVAVGPVTEVRYKGSKLISRSLEEVPPSVLLIKSRKSDKNVRLRVGNNKVAPFVRLPAEKSLTIRRKIAPQLDQTEPYFSLKPLKQGSRYLLLLRPVGKYPSLWAPKPKLHLLHLDSNALRGKDLLMINFSTRHLLSTLEGQPKSLAPMSISSFFVDRASYKKIVVTEKATPKKPLIQTTLSVLPKQLNLLIFYQANPATNRGKEIGLIKSVVPRPHRIKTDEQGREVSPIGFESDP